VSSAALAAKTIGNDEIAAKYFKALLDQCKGSNSERVELKEAAEYLRTNNPSSL